MIAVVSKSGSVLPPGCARSRKGVGRSEARLQVTGGAVERFWKAALGVAGIGAVAFFVFWGLYKQWLSLPIFANLNADQTFVLMLVFLALTFLALIAGVISWLRSRAAGGES